MKRIGLVLAAFALASCGAKSDAQAEAAQGAVPAGQNAGLQSAPAISRPPAAALAPRQPLPPGVYAVEKKEVVDASGFERPLVAGTIMIPAGWSMQGGIQWSPAGPCGPDFASTVSLRSPDGASTVTVVPAQTWIGARTNFPLDKSQGAQCPEAFFTTAREFLEASAQRMFPGARVIDYRALPEKVKPLQDMLAQMPPLPPTQGMEHAIGFDAGEVLIAYQQNGQEMRAAISTMVTLTRMRVADMLNPGQIALDQVTGAPTELFVVSAPAGALDLSLRDRIQKSVRFNPEWMQRINAYFAEKNRINAKGAADRHAIRMDAIKKQGEIINGMYEDRQLSSDRNQREFIESIRGVETYDDPVYGGPVQLDSTYDHAWRVNGHDAYIMTNDVNFNPGQYGLDAQKLEVTR
jgi:hypothetical protein